MTLRTRDTSYTFAHCLAAALICGAGASGCAGIGAAEQSETRHPHSSIARPVNDGQCPVLTGTYHEIGDGRFDNTKTYVAHLMGNAFADSFYGKGNASDREALYVRVFHPTTGSLRLEAVDNNEVVGMREFGPNGGWYCSQQRLVSFSAMPFNIEAGSGTQVQLVTYSFSVEQKLCRTTEWDMNYWFGGPRDSGYSSIACYSRKTVGE